MVLPPIDTPRTDFAASVTQGPDKLAEITQSSIPSPSKEKNDIVQKIRGMRPPEQGTPRSRPPFADRRNLQQHPKPEFTPLLKSATRNRSHANGKENIDLNGKPATPAGFRQSFRSELLDLPENSSVLYQDDTASDGGRQPTPQVPQSSSSAIATPMPALNGKNGAALGEAQYGSLREQEAVSRARYILNTGIVLTPAQRVEQLDKELFSLKMRCYYLEEALKKSGKDFNQKALEENTNLKVDKLTLERDMRRYRKESHSAQKELEECRRRMEEYLEKLKNSNADRGMQDELDRLQRTLEENNGHIRTLEEAAESNNGHEEELQGLRDTISDLEHELRQKDQELDEKDDQIDEFKQTSDSSGELAELKRQLEERDEDIKGLQDALRTAGAESERKLKEKDRALELKDDEVHDLEKELDDANRDESFAVKGKELEGRQGEIDRLRHLLEQQQAQAKKELDDLKRQLDEVHQNAAAEARQRIEAANEKEHEIRALGQQLATAQGRDTEVEKLNDRIADLESELKERERSIDGKDDQIDDLKSKIQQIENDSDEELIAAQDRIQELEIEQQRHLKDLQALRENEGRDEAGRSHALQRGEHRIVELESFLSQARENEKQLQREIHRTRDDLAHVQRELDSKETQAKSESENWTRQRRHLEDSRSRMEEKVRNLEELISQLRESEGTLSGQEMALQRLLESERQQHASNQRAAQEQLQDANTKCEELRVSLQKRQSQLHDVESQASRHAEEKQKLQDNIESLEDEIDVLQSSLDDEATRSKDELSAARSEAESLRRQLTGLKSDLAKTESAHAVTKSELVSIQKELDASPRRESTTPSQRALRARVAELENEQQTAAEVEARMRAVDAERKALQEKLDAHEDSLQRLRMNPPQPRLATAEVQQSQNLHDQIEALRQEKEELEDDLDVLSSDLDTVISDRDEALATVDDLRKQLSDAARAAETSHRKQIATYERDIADLEASLDAAKTAQRESAIRSETTNATIARLRSRLQTAETDLATARARERTSASPETKRADLREAQAQVDEAHARLQRREERIRSLESREDELRTQLKSTQNDRRTAARRAEALTADLHNLRTTYDQLARAAHSTGAAQTRHDAELRGLAKQIAYLTARCTRAEKLRQDAAFAKSYVAKVVEVYARVHKLDLRICRDMGVVIDERPVVKLGGGVDATPRGKSGAASQTEEVVRRRERPRLKHVALAVRAALRMRKRAEAWREVRKAHEGVLGAWRSLRERRKKNIKG